MPWTVGLASSRAKPNATMLIAATTVDLACIILDAERLASQGGTALGIHQAE
jgi:hypothetical protein